MSLRVVYHSSTQPAGIGHRESQEHVQVLKTSMQGLLGLDRSMRGMCMCNSPTAMDKQTSKKLAAMLAAARTCITRRLAAAAPSSRQRYAPARVNKLLQPTDVNPVHKLKKSLLPHELT